MLAICCPHVGWQKTIRRTIPQHIPMKLTAFRGFRFTKALGLKHWGNCRALRGTPIELNWSSLAYPSSCHDNWGGKSLVFKHSHHVACIYVIIVRLCMYLSLSLCMYVTNYEFSIPIKWHLTYFMIFRGLPNVIILVAPQFQSFWPRSSPMVFAGSFARSGNRFFVGTAAAHFEPRARLPPDQFQHTSILQDLLFLNFWEIWRIRNV